MFEKENEAVLETKVIVFWLKNEQYGVPIDQVKTIEPMQPFTRVPRTPEFVKGVINLRGVVTPVIDLRERFDLEQAPYTEETRIVVVSVEGMEVGLVVDSANDVVDVPTHLIEPAPDIVGGIRATYLNGIAKLSDRLLVLLNLPRVLKREEIQRLEHLEDVQ